MPNLLSWIQFISQELQSWSFIAYPQLSIYLFLIAYEPIHFQLDSTDPKLSASSSTFVEVAVYIPPNPAQITPNSCSVCLVNSCFSPQS